MVGQSLEVVEIDDEYWSEKASQAYQRLADRDQVAAVIGVAGDGIFPIMEQLSRYKVAMIWPPSRASRDWVRPKR